MAGMSLNGGEWIALNYDQTGYYRVNYSSQLWRLLVNQLYTDHKVHYVDFIYIISSVYSAMRLNAMKDLLGLARDSHAISVVGIL